jgi:hypothetical protein
MLKGAFMSRRFSLPGLLRVSLGIALLAAASGAARPAPAQSLTVGLPDDVKFVVRVDLPAIRDSEVAGKMFADAKAKLLEKVAEKHNAPEMSADKIIEVLGFDPFEEIQSIVLAGSNFESPERGLVGGVQLRKTSGNLEGLMLALPGYKSEEYDGTQIHSATPEEGHTIYGAIHTGGDGTRTVFVAAQREAIERMLDSANGNGGGGNGKSATLGDASPGDGGRALVELNVFELPAELQDEEGPPANLAKIVKSIKARIAESDGKVHVVATVATEAEKQAEQLEQMVKGLKAMLDLAVTAHGEDDEALKKFQALAAELTVKKNGASLELSLSLPAEEVRALIDKNLHDKD